MKKKQMIIQMALAVMLLLPGTILAQAMTDVQYLVLTQTDGTVSKFALGDSPIITYSAGDVVVTCNGQTFKTSMEGVANCTFTTEKVPSGIENLQAEGSKAVFAFSTASFDGMKPSSTITVYTLDGKAVASTTADNDGHATVSLAQLGRGVYIIRTPQKSYKVKR